jgi:sterol desaturase/sphingolipid hydroxylase (fatty acid hydroxylase superfamily)
MLTESWLKNPYYFFTLLTLVNVLFYFLTYLFSSYWGCSRKQKLKKKTWRDFSLTLLVLLSNILVAIPGYFLFIYGQIDFTYEVNFSIFFEFLLLFLLVDFLMYLLHNISHKVRFFKQLHQEHHRHKIFNELSLYVMNPLEVFGLGLLFTALFYLYDFNIYAVVAFLILNWFWGVIAHFNVDKTSPPKLFSNNFFHAIHHKNENYNLGFYTVIWDKLFKSYSDHY